MGKLTLSSLAITLTILGAAVISGHPAWGTITGIAILLLAAAMASGALPIESVSQDYALERKAAGKKISNGLVTLSSAAIIAVYAAGYHRTSSAADKFEAQTARRKTAPPVTSSFVAPVAALPKITDTLVVPQSATAPPRKSRAQTSSKTSRKLTPTPAPTVSSEMTPSDLPAARTAPDSTSTTAPATTANAIGDPSAPTTAPEKTTYKDGSYTGSGDSRHGGIDVIVEIQRGKISYVAVEGCFTRYPCYVISELPDRVITKQSPKVDYVSGATDSCDAFLDAVAQALSKASE